MRVALLILAVCAASVRAGEPFLDVDSNRGGIGNLKALQVGDIITILIVENASANAQTKTDTQSKTETSGGPGLGMLNRITEWGLDTENKFQGDGKSSRTGSLDARISATILEVLPNNNYRIGGQRVVEINGEKQHLELTGTIRARDLGPDNVIESTYVADAHILYDGHGALAEAGSPGLLSRLANLLF